MLTTMRNHWWMLVGRGALAVLFGVLAMIIPGLTLAMLVIMVGAYILLDGIGALYTSWKSRPLHTNWWVMAIEGAAGVLIGLITVIWPGITAVILLYLIALWAIITGAIEIMGAIQLRKEISNEFLLGVAGVISMAFGAFLVIAPTAGALAVIWIIGIYAILFGITLIMLGLRIKNLPHDQIPPHHDSRVYGA